VILQNALRVLIVLWAGSLWSLAAWVAPTLFYAQSDRHLAGLLAAKLFAIETYVGIAVALLGLIHPGRRRFRSIYVAVVLLAINEWVLKRVMALAQARGAAAGLSFGAWHGVAALLYLIACIGVLVLIWNEDFR
jgi:Domain of unknown function (DUF4149)